MVLDASGSSGTGLRFGLDFGDGTGTDQSKGTHVYQTGPRVYKARVVVTDSTGRTDTADVDVAVESAEGNWYNSIYNASNRRYESRYLNIVTQAGTTVSGLYTHPEGYQSSFAGELLPDRGMRLQLMGRGITFSTSTPGGFSSNARSVAMFVRGGSADGQTLLFSR